MAVAPAAYNYMTTTSGNGLFDDVSSNGLVQGTAYADPSTVFRLRSGWLSGNETIPMWGGVAIYSLVGGVANGPVKSLGTQVGRAVVGSSTLPIAGFSVFDQAYGMVNTPASPVPTCGSYQQVQWYPMGSLARIAVACDPILVDLYGEKISSQVSWDYTNQLLVPYIGTLTISSGTYTSATGVIVLTMSAAVGFSAGDSVILSSLTGTGAYASLDGTWTTTAVSGSTVTIQGPVGAGAATITGGSLTLGSGASTALACSVLEIQPGNSQTVNYSAASNTAAWNYSGTCAIIQI